MNSFEPTHEQIEAETRRYEILGGTIKRLPAEFVRDSLSRVRVPEPNTSVAYEPDFFAHVA